MIDKNDCKQNIRPENYEYRHLSNTLKCWQLLLVRLHWLSNRYLHDCFIATNLCTSYKKVWTTISEHILSKIAISYSLD